jgi:hypothetical protein
MAELADKGGFSNWEQHWQDWADLRKIGARNIHPR